MSAFPHVDFLLSVAARGQLPPDEGVEIAFAGRSNSGKSSAINAIMARKSLARTSKTPGQTRLLNYFEVTPGCRLVDLPGYGYAAVAPAERAKWLPLLEALRARGAFRGLFLIIDSRRGVREEDLALIDWADPARRAIHVLLAKADKLNRTEGQSVLRDARQQIGDACTAQLFSAHGGTGIREAQACLTGWLAQKTPVTSDEATGAD